MERRKVIHIDEEKCSGCGQCLTACAEGALQIVDGVARLVSEIYCDGLGDCLGECPEGALTLEEREAEAFDEAAVRVRLAESPAPDPLPCGCPGSQLRTITAASRESAEQPTVSKLGHWPVQLRLVPASAPFLADADLLICADCVPFAVPELHDRYLDGRVALVGCPKLDDLGEHQEKLRSIVRDAKPRNITVLRMEVPCCAGLTRLVEDARSAVASDCPLAVHVVGIDGKVCA